MIHKYQLNNMNIVMDIHSGAIHIFDDLAYKMLDFVSENLTQDDLQKAINSLENEFSKTDIEEAFANLCELKNSDTLFSEDDYDQFEHMIDDAPVKAMCLHIAHDCNLRCSYCFASTGDFGEGRKIMDTETGKKAIDYLISHSGNRRNLEVDFFGGEPLMNFKSVKEITEYARSIEKQHNKNFRFTMTTNGLLLNDEITEFINKEMYNAVLSIDGRKEVNDATRVRVDGTGCYDSIVPKFQKLVAGRDGKDYYVRGTFTRNNLDFSEDVYHLAELGFEQISVEPVVSDDGNPYAIREEDLPAINKEYEKLALRIIESRKKGEYFNFFHFMIDLEQGPCAIKRLRGCGCGNEYIAVTPDSDVYPCHQFVGKPEWKIGHLDNPVINKEMKHQFATASVFTKNQCKDCWVKFYCSGGCNSNNLDYAGSILNPHSISCELEKKRIECAIMIKAAELAE